MPNPAMDEFVERVLSASDILGVVSGYVSLRMKGGRWWGICPFHQEKTPSFSVVPDEGFFYCFGCHAGGNVFKFLSLIENIGYFDAVKMQAEKLGIPLPGRNLTGHEADRAKKLSDLGRVLEMASDFFHNCLTKTRYGKEALAYLKSRGIDATIISSARLGFAPDSYEKLHRAFQRRGISDELLVKSGLVAEGRGGLYDRFRARVMIPIADDRGRIVGFGGRALGKVLPKYLNSPETPLFNKRKILFGLDRAKKAIRQAGRSILVEGYMDAISLAARGVTNVAASLGTSFTIEQCRLLMRFAPEIYFCYDSDEAGQKATMRALSIIKATGARARVLIVPDGKDPDEFIRKHGVEEFRALMASALPIAEYQIGFMMKRSDLRTPEGKNQALRSVLPVLARNTSAVEQEAHIARLSRTLGITEGVIREELRRWRGDPSPSLRHTSAVTRRPIRHMDDATRHAARVMIRAAWEDAGALIPLDAVIPPEEFPSRIHGDILRYIRQAAENGERPGYEGAVAALDEKAAEELTRALAEGGERKLTEEEYDDCVRTLKRARLQMLYEESRMRADAMEKEGNTNFMQELKKSQRIRQEIDDL